MGLWQRKEAGIPVRICLESPKGSGSAVIENPALSISEMRRSDKRKAYLGGNV